MTATQPARIAHRPLVGADVQPLTVLDIHRDERIPIGYLPYLDEQRHIEISRHKQAACAKEQHNHETRDTEQYPGESRNELPVFLEAFNLHLARFIVHVLLAEIVQRTHTGAKRTNGNNVLR